MKILLISQYFYPENFKGNDIAFHLAEKGYDVTVLTGKPNYSKDNFFEGYNFFNKNYEVIDGVKIYRSFLIPRGKSNLQLVLNYISWIISSCIYAVYLGVFKKYDKVFVQQLSPVTVGLPGLIVSKLNKIPMYFWVLDLWPESLSGGGGVSNKKILSFFERLVKLFYKNSYKILISSLGFKQSIINKGDFEGKIIYFPNWAEDTISNGNLSYTIPQLPEGFKIVFAGNIGEAQDMETIMSAALLLKDTDVKIILIGDGRKMSYVKEFIKNNNLTETVYLMGRYPLEAMSAFFNKADLLMVSLKDDKIFNLTLPAKVQAYMSSGKPILGMMNGDGFDTIKKANCGFCVPASNVELLAKEMIRASQMDKNLLNDMGNNGLLFYEKYFQKNVCMNNLENILK